MRPRVFAVVGRGYGDEGKGLATDFLASLFKGKTCVVRHNGGAQSGHTVEKRSGERFVFHELSSGSLSGADTLWVNTFFPDMYKLSEEAEDFKAAFGYVPKIYAESDTPITLIFDVLLNMAQEEKRGDGRHGSCGMGINEADLRVKAGFGVTLKDVFSLSFDELRDKLLRIRESYVRERESILEITSVTEYIDLLYSDDVLNNYCKKIKENTAFVTLVSGLEKFLSGYDTIIFETGQGLLLDADNEENAPHVTASKTGLTNIVSALSRTSLELDTVFYVSRSYLTRHGAGPLNHESDPSFLKAYECDQTNVSNEWQGSLRYARFSSFDDFFAPITVDLKSAKGAKSALLLTHLNETGGCIKLAESDVSIKDLISEAGKRGISKVYTSSSRFSDECVLCYDGHK